MDAYRLLGVNPGDDDSTIRDAFRRYAATHHPDRGGDAAEFQRGVDAFHELCEQPARIPGSLGTHRRQNPIARLVRRWIHPRHDRRVV
jgi:hypothetical protein